MTKFFEPKPVRSGTSGKPKKALPLRRHGGKPVRIRKRDKIGELMYGIPDKDIKRKNFRKARSGK